eukprot:m.41768 g.41768  ORF g.41768 m.41768 type:complete len:1136 (-) comp14980_c0_seq1:2697-6104(-)
MWDDAAFNEDITALQQLSDRICDVVLRSERKEETGMDEKSDPVASFTEELNASLSQIITDIRSVTVGVGAAFFKGLHRDLVRLFVKGRTYKQESYSKCEKLLKAYAANDNSTFGALNPLQMVALLRVLQLLIPFGGLDRPGTLADVFVHWLSRCSRNECSASVTLSGNGVRLQQTYLAEYKAALHQLCLSFVTTSRSFSEKVAHTALSLALAEVHGGSRYSESTALNPGGILMKILSRGLTVHTASTCDVMLQRLLPVPHDRQPPDICEHERTYDVVFQFLAVLANAKTSMASDVFDHALVEMLLRSAESSGRLFDTLRGGHVLCMLLANAKSVGEHIVRRSVSIIVRLLEWPQRVRRRNGLTPWVDAAEDGDGTLVPLLDVSERHAETNIDAAAEDSALLQDEDVSSGWSEAQRRCTHQLFQVLYWRFPRETLASLEEAITRADNASRLQQCLQGLTDGLALHPLLLRGWHPSPTAPPPSPPRTSTSGGAVGIATRARSATASTVIYPSERTRGGGADTVLHAVDSSAVFHAMTPVHVDGPDHGMDSLTEQAASRTRSAGDSHGTRADRSERALGNERAVYRVLSHLKQHAASLAPRTEDLTATSPGAPQAPRNHDDMPASVIRVNTVPQEDHSEDLAVTTLVEDVCDAEAPADATARPSDAEAMRGCAGRADVAVQMARAHGSEGPSDGVGAVLARRAAPRPSTAALQALQQDIHAMTTDGNTATMAKELLVHRLHTLHLETTVGDQRKHIQSLTRKLRKAENELATMQVVSNISAGVVDGRGKGSLSRVTALSSPTRGSSDSQRVRSAGNTPNRSHSPSLAKNDGASVVAKDALRLSSPLFGRSLSRSTSIDVTLEDSSGAGDVSPGTSTAGDMHRSVSVGTGAPTPAPTEEPSVRKPRLSAPLLRVPPADDVAGVGRGRKQDTNSEILAPQAIAHMSEENARLRADNAALVAEVVPLRRETERLEVALDRTTTELTLLLRAEKELRAVAVDRDALATRVDELSEAIVSWETQLPDRSAILIFLERSRHEKVLLDGERASLAEELAATRADLAEAESQLEVLRIHNATLQAREAQASEVLHRQVQALNHAHTVSAAKLRALECKYTTTKHINVALNARIVQLHAEIEAARQG